MDRLQVPVSATVSTDRQHVTPAATKPESEHGHDGGKNRDHARDGTAVARKSLVTLGVSEV
jgi:hypothetical protein